MHADTGGARRGKRMGAVRRSADWRGAVGTQELDAPGDGPRDT